ACVSPSVVFFEGVGRLVAAASKHGAATALDQVAARHVRVGQPQRLHQLHHVGGPVGVAAADLLEQLVGGGVVGVAGDPYHRVPLLGALQLAVVVGQGNDHDR